MVVDGIIFVNAVAESGRNFMSKGLKKNLNAPRPSEHPPVWGKKCQNV